MQHFSYAALITLCVILPSASADDPDPVRENIERDKQAFAAAEAKAKTELTAALDKQLAAARQDGKLSAVEKLKSEKERFEADGTLPKSVPTADYARKMRDAQKSLDLSFDTAIK